MAIAAKNFSINNDGQVVDMIIEFIKEIPKNNNPIYWGTFNVSLTKKDKSLNMIERIKNACGSNHLRVICESPDNQSAPYNKRSLLTKDAFYLLEKNGVEVKYFSNRDDENAAGIDRVHHAKYLVSENSLLIGSFNLSYQSLHGNVESLVWLEGVEIKDIYESLSTKWNDGVFESIDPDKLIEQRLPKRDRPILYEGLVDFERLYASVLEKLNGYQNGYQVEILKKLFDRDFQEDILSLPTGLGKTFIGIAWLLKQGKDVGNEAKLLIITPNRLITETIKNICENELKIPELVNVVNGNRPAINIKRAADFLDEDLSDDFSAVIFDEVHNWSRDELNEYNRAQKILRKNKNIKILGISATPSRHPNYDQDYFYRAFCGRQAGSPLSEYTAIYAIGQKWLTRPEWKLISNSCDDLEYYIPIKGKYTEKTLMREWRNTLMEDIDLVDKIVNVIKENKLKKGLVYMPPVGEDLSDFVEEFREKMSVSGCGEVLDIQSRSCINPEKEIKKFRASKKPVFLISINRASEGISIPEIDSLIMLRMPLSDNLAIQMIGRGLRLYPGKNRLFFLDAVSYQKRLKSIPAWGQAAIKQIIPSEGVSSEKSIEAKVRNDSCLKIFVDLVADCRSDDFKYAYDVFLRNRVNCFLERKAFDQLVSDGLSGDLKREFGLELGIKVYGINREKDKKILAKLANMDNSSEILQKYIEKNKESFTNRYIRKIENEIWDQHLDENYLLSLVKENFGDISCEQIVEHFLAHASPRMRKYLLWAAFDYDEDYVKTIMRSPDKCKSALIARLVRSAEVESN